MKKIILIILAVSAVSVVQAQMDTLGKFPYFFYYDWHDAGVVHDGITCTAGLGSNTLTPDEQPYWSSTTYWSGDICEQAFYRHTDTPLHIIGLAVGAGTGQSEYPTKIAIYDSTLKNEIASVTKLFIKPIGQLLLDSNIFQFYFPGISMPASFDLYNNAFSYFYFEFFDDEIVLSGDFYIGVEAVGFAADCFIWPHPENMVETHSSPYNFHTTYKLRFGEEWVGPRVMDGWQPVIFPIVKLPCNPVDSVSVTLSSDGCLTADWEQPALQSAWTVKLTLPNGNEIIQPVDTNHWEYCGLATNQQYSLHVRSRCDDLNGHSWSDWGEGFTVGTNGIGSAQRAPDFTLTPNPARGTVTVGGFEGEGSVEIVDMAGRVSGQWPVAGGQRTIDISRLPAGSYVVRLTTAEGTASRMLQVE